ncbi:hypothetical protein UFOVP952_54 [uncultured Caudovirales phage]|uniref:Uncharacterized protein n=1 Tax=uncultured Caudovirales phage TaxID=2100421 RepID=A0A6J7XIC7_9CAUD|nr:hypothetical protein UFOVP952_54 [uncultured Caudovirales phage]CAB4204288.1 hypothetical protein UFOVP1392_44 [uncultured Caudovirales phage]CAB5230179.1 hypothetical protein UFOVP1569_43 [uncultured Caudovirales phage]
MKRYGAHRGMKEKADGGWVRYEDVQELRASMMALAEFQQELGDARGFRRGLNRIGCTPGTVKLLVRQDRA